MTLREELQNRADKLDAELLALSGRIRAIERESDDVHTCINALDIAEMDAQDAALQPTPDITFNDIEPVSVTIEAPALADPLSAELRSDPGSEENAGTNSDAPYSIDWGNEPISQPADQSEEERIAECEAAYERELHESDSEPLELSQAEQARWDALCAESEPETYTDDLRTAEGETVAGDDRIETQSVTSDPDFVALVERAEATLAAAEPAYVGLQDPELDADYDAMKERETADRKLHFSIFGKREEV